MKHFIISGTKTKIGLSLGWVFQVGLPNTTHRVLSCVPRCLNPWNSCTEESTTLYHIR